MNEASKHVKPETTGISRLSGVLPRETWPAQRRVGVSIVSNVSKLRVPDECWRPDSSKKGIEAAEFYHEAGAGVW